MDVKLDIMEMLWNTPNNKTLKEVLEFSMQWAQLCREKGEQSGAFLSDDFSHEDFGRVVESEKKGEREVIHYAYKLKRVAKLITIMFLDVKNMANAITNLIPSLLEVAMGFDKLVSSIQPLMKERNQIFGDL
jgi:hypothetical protein